MSSLRFPNLHVGSSGLRKAGIAAQVGETRELRGVLEILLLCCVCAVSNSALYICVCITYSRLYICINTYICAHIWDCIICRRQRYLVIISLFYCYQSQIFLPFELPVNKYISLQRIKAETFPKVEKHCLFQSFPNILAVLLASLLMFLLRE